jgi:hypothetical protein
VSLRAGRRGPGGEEGKTGPGHKLFRGIRVFTARPVRPGGGSARDGDVAGVFSRCVARPPNEPGRAQFYGCIVARYQLTTGAPASAATTAPVARNVPNGTWVRRPALPNAIIVRPTREPRTLANMKPRKA